MQEDDRENGKIGHELLTLTRLIRRKIENDPNRAHIASITGYGGWLIGYIAHSEGDVFQRDIERDFCVTRSTASKVVNLLVEKGMVEKRPVERDARLKKLVLTPTACQIAARMRANGMKMSESLLEGFTREERAQLTDFIRRMKKNIQRDAAQDALRGADIDREVNP